MRYLRKQVLNRRAPYDQRLYIDANDGVVMTTPFALTLPKGSTTDKPDSASRTVGMIRYNTTTDEVEVYQGPSGYEDWRTLRYKESGGITQQTLGYGDSITEYFGPLNPAPPTTVQTGSTWGGQNLLVIVENVIQIHVTNYTIVNNPTIDGQEYLPKTTGVTAIGSTIIYFDVTALPSPGPTDFHTIYPSVDITGAVLSGDSAIQAGSVIQSYTVNNDGQLTSITIDLPTQTTTIASGTILTITDSTNVGTGAYLRFSSAVPYGKPVIVLHGFDR